MNDAPKSPGRSKPPVDAAPDGARSDAAPPEPEFSWPVDVSKLPDKGIARRIAPDAAQRAAIAERLGLLALDAFEVEIRVTPWRGAGARLEAAFTADVVQRCVVTLDPVPQHVEDRFTLTFLPPDRLPAPAPGEEILLSAEDEEDMPEPLEGPEGTLLDAGELAVQYLSLALDPYPRAPGARVPEQYQPRPEDDVSPFAALAALRKSEKDE